MHTPAVLPASVDHKAWFVVVVGIGIGKMYTRMRDSEAEVYIGLSLFIHRTVVQS